jgi:hypothetical protein
MRVLITGTSTGIGLATAVVRKSGCRFQFSRWMSTRTNLLMT